jgi:RNA polymerase sigma-70 factor (ECF subfamily)
VLSVADPAVHITRPPAERFDDLFRHFYPRLVPLAQRLLGERAEAEDIVQEAFLRLARAERGAPTADGRIDDHTSPGDWRADGTDAVAASSSTTHLLLDRPDEVVGAWLRRVVLNLGVNRLRDRRRADERLARAGRLDVTLDPERDPNESGSPSQALVRAETRDEVRAALADLPERQRACLLLRHGGHSYAEIAATLGMAIGSVGVYLARAERAFRAAYGGKEPEAGSESTQGTTP